MPIRRLAAVAVLPVVLLAAACQSQYWATDRRTDMVTTDLVVRTTPSGAMVYVAEQEVSPSPMRMPVEYPHVTTTYRRQTNVGARLRESWGTVGTILGFPIWLPLSLFHATEERYRHEYGSNRFTVSAVLPGHDEAWEEVVLEGQDTFEVDLTLPPSR